MALSETATSLLETFKCTQPDGNHNQFFKHRGCRWKERRNPPQTPLHHHHHHLSLKHLFISPSLQIFSDLWGTKTIPCGGETWMAADDSLIGKCLELCEVKASTPCGNPLWLTCVSLALSVSITPCWWKSIEAIKQRRSAWVSNGQSWRAWRTPGRWVRGL